MALTVGVNSLDSVANADAYFIDRLNGSSWTALSQSTKEQALVTATGILSQKPWLGVAKSPAMFFPREGSFLDPSLGIEVAMDPTPTRILHALYELALHLASNTELLAEQTTFDSISVSSISIDFKSTPSKVPARSVDLIGPLLGPGLRAWWRAN